jgi:hypothetical protein
MLEKMEERAQMFITWVYICICRMCRWAYSDAFNMNRAKSCAAILMFKLVAQVGNLTVKCIVLFFKITDLCAQFTDCLLHRRKGDTELVLEGDAGDFGEDSGRIEHDTAPEAVVNEGSDSHSLYHTSGASATAARGQSTLLSAPNGNHTQPNPARRFTSLTKENK